MSNFLISYRDLSRTVSKGLAVFRADMPGVMKGFNDLAREATSAGVLDSKTKKLMAVALGADSSGNRQPTFLFADAFVET